MRRKRTRDGREERAAPSKRARPWPGQVLNGVAYFVAALSSLVSRARKAAFDAGILKFFGDVAALHEPTAFARYISLRSSMPSARSTARDRSSTISAATRIVSPSPTSGCGPTTTASCAYQGKDYCANDKSEAMTRDADEFVRRSLMHVLPEGLRRIRRFGFLANARGAQKLAHSRAALDIVERFAK